MNAAHLLLRQVCQLCKRIAQRVDALAMGPDGQATAPQKAHCAGRADRAVQLVSAAIARLDDPAGQAEPTPLDHCEPGSASPASNRGCAPKVRFASDSLLEGDGFELSVPQSGKGDFVCEGEAGKGHGDDKERRRRSGTKETLWGGRQGMATLSLHVTMECRNAPAERLEQVPRRPGPE
jgi:hypothetical protein